MNLKMISRIYLLSGMMLMVTVVCGCMPHPEPAPLVYTLADEEKASETSQTSRPGNEKPVLKLMQIRGAAPFTSADILYRDRNYGINSYAYSRWSDAPVTMLEGFLLAFLERGSLFSSVLPPSSAASGGLILESLLQDFSLHISAGKHAHAEVKVIFYLIDTHKGRLPASKEIAVSVPAAGTDADHAVSAINSAVLKVAQELQTWLAAEIERRR